jgi:DNA mismatch repair protein MutL
MKEDNHDNTIEALEVLEGRVIGQAFSTYIFVQGAETLYIIDQHAAHERLLYERYKALIDAGGILSQQLLSPVVLEVTHSEFILIQDHLTLFQRTGFELEPFGGAAYLVRGVPMLLKDVPVQSFFNRLTDAVQKGGRTAHSALLEADIIKLSCKTAVKAGDRLSDPEILKLLQDIQAGDIPFTCPHGRPILISMSRYELEKRFMRIQP